MDSKKSLPQQGINPMPLAFKASGIELVPLAFKASVMSTAPLVPYCTSEGSQM